MKTHELKTWPVFYKSIIDGTKTFEVRKNDRDFQLGDVLLLREYDPDAEQYTGAKTERVITYILGDNPFFQLNAMVILGISPLPQQESERSAEEFAEKRWQESQGEFSVTNFMEGFKYASQFKLLPVPSVTITDEDAFKKDLAIEILARFSTQIGRGVPIEKRGFIDGAKWAISQLPPKKQYSQTLIR